MEERRISQGYEEPYIDDLEEEDEQRWNRMKKATTLSYNMLTKSMYYIKAQDCELLVYDRLTVDDATVEKVIELLREYRYLFPTNIMELKGIRGELGMMKITLKPDVKPVKQQPYRLNLKYKEKVREELDKMLATEIIELVEESDWLSLMVV
eukprot:PITA_25695